MNVKSRLVRSLPTRVKRWLSVPYDVVKTRRADRAFDRKSLRDREPADDAPDHVVVIVVDALRGDAIDEAVTPFLAELEGTIGAVAPSPWTFPSVTSMMTGRYPHEHGTLRPENPDAEGLQIPPKLDQSVESLSEVFAGAGYDTYGGFGHETPFLALSGRFEDHALFHTITASAEDVFDAYYDWFAGRDRTFAFLHLADPHVPVDPPTAYWEDHDVDDTIPGIQRWKYRDVVDPTPEVERFREHRRRLYRAAVDYVDDQVRTLYERLPDDAAFVVTSDHGEAFWEQVALDTERFDGTGVVGHGGTPYEGVSRVPLLADGIDLQDGNDTSLIDLAPTLLEAVGLPDALDTTGYSLLDEVPDDRMPLIEGTRRGDEKKAIYRGDWKLIASEEATAEFHLPDEELVTIPDDEKTRMEAALPDSDAVEGETEVSDLTRQRLEDLGYR